jgi:thiamine biosynthesis lipoprotein
MMGTFVQISCASGKSVLAEQGINLAFQEIRRIESVFSNFLPESDIFRINNAREGFIPVKKETIELISKAKAFYENTDGAFDITVAPLLKTWGFYNKEQRHRLIPASEIKNNLVLIGSDKILIDESENKVGFKVPGMAIDLGGIVPGYAVDRARDILVENGIKNALINLGGDIYCLGSGRTPQGWKVGIQHPLKSGEIIATLSLRDRAVTTSGSYENFIEIEQRRFSHIIDPRTGYPVDNGLLSVTVVADDCMTADALATAVFVLGSLKGEILLKSFKAEAFMISQADKGLTFHITDGLKQILEINHVYRN